MIMMMESLFPQSQWPLRVFLHVYLSQLASSSLVSSYSLHDTLPQSIIWCWMQSTKPRFVRLFKIRKSHEITLNHVRLWSLYHHDINKNPKSALANANQHKFWDPALSHPYKVDGFILVMADLYQSGYSRECPIAQHCLVENNQFIYYLGMPQKCTKTDVAWRTAMFFPYV